MPEGLESMGVIQAMFDIDKISRGNGVDIQPSQNLEPLLSWLCNVNIKMRDFIANPDALIFRSEVPVVAKALGYDLYHSVEGDSIDQVFSRLRENLNRHLRVLQSICHDPAADFDKTDISALMAFCAELSKSLMANKKPVIRHLAA